MSKDYKPKKITALDKIAQYCSSNVICKLIFVLKNRNQLLREKVCNTIIQFFERIKNKKNITIYKKNCEISLEDIDYYTKKFNPEQLVYLLIIGFLNSIGYIREQSIKKLAEISDEKSIHNLLTLRLGTACA